VHLNNEFFAQQGAGDPSLSDVLQVLEAALEELAVCEDAQAGCTTLFICLRNLSYTTHRIAHDSDNRLEDASVGKRGLYCQVNLPWPFGMFTSKQGRTSAMCSTVC